MQAFYPGRTSAAKAETPQLWDPASEEAEDFSHRIHSAAQPLLICDYDGTLAPFRENKMEAVPYPGVAEQLERIASGPSRLAFVSGRPSAELVTLLPLAAGLEIWGMHGRERRMPGGAVSVIGPTPSQREALDTAEAALRAQGLAGAVERKIASIAVHWRAAEASSARRAKLERVACDIFAPHAGKHGLALLPFDGGLELRAEDRTKKHATEALLATLSDTGAAAFLGDDTTDEDAFAAMAAAGGLPLLVRYPPRPSFARYWLRPPDALLAFLNAWP